MGTSVSANGKTEDQEEASSLISLQHIHKTYNLGEQIVHALQDISLEIPRGQFLGMMGASGSGKSTMLNIVGCLDRLCSGTYLLDGESLLWK